MQNNKNYCTWYNDEFLHAEITDMFARYQGFHEWRTSGGRDPNVWKYLGNYAWQKRKVAPGPAKTQKAITY